MGARRALTVAAVVVAIAVAVLIATAPDSTGPPSCVPDCVRGQTRLGMDADEAKQDCRARCRAIALDREVRGAPR